MPLQRHTSNVSPDERSSREALWRKRLAIETRFVRHHPEFRADEPMKEWRSVVLIRTALRLVGLWNLGVRNAKRIELRRLTLTFDSLPEAFDGFRILHLSDFHFFRPTGIPDTLYDVVRGLDVDVCALTGDFRFSRRAPQAYAIDGLKRLTECVRPRHGFYAVLGNNDTSALVEPYRAMGISVLMNEPAKIERGGQGVWIAGVDDPHEFRCANLDQAVEDIPEGAFTILLAHSPDLVFDAAASGIDVYLCGHTHGGQICLPWFGAIHLNSNAPREYGSGRWRRDAMYGYTTTGVGASTLPIRFFCPPEAVVIELRRGPVEGASETVS